MQDISIHKNDVGGYEYNVAVTLIKQINRVLEHKLFEELADGMVGNGNATPSPLWAAPWIHLRRASHYSIIKIIRQLENSKSVWLYLFYSLIITITIMLDGGALFCVWSDAKVHVKAQMQEISIHNNNVGGYEYNAAVTLIKQINCVLEHQLFED